MRDVSLGTDAFNGVLPVYSHWGADVPYRHSGEGRNPSPARSMDSGLRRN